MVRAAAYQPIAPVGMMLRLNPLKAHRYDRLLVGRHIGERRFAPVQSRLTDQTARYPHVLEISTKPRVDEFRSQRGESYDTVLIRSGTLVKQKCLRISWGRSSVG